MSRFARVLGPIACLLALAACATSQPAPTGVTAPQGGSECRKGGEPCRWDKDCCSGRCYVDTGCSG